MEIQNNSDLKWENGTETKKSAKLSLDLDVQDILQVHDERGVGRTLNAQKSHIKSGIFHLVRNQVLPDSVNANDDKQGQKEKRTETPMVDVDNTFSATTDFVRGKLNAVSNMVLTVDIESEEAISETEAFSEAIDVIASNVSETLFHNLDEIHNGARGFNVGSFWTDTDYNSVDKAA